MFPHIDVVVWTESKAAFYHSTVRLSAFCNPLVIRSHQLLDGAREEGWLSEQLIQPTVGHSILTDKESASVGLVPSFTLILYLVLYYFKNFQPSLYKVKYSFINDLQRIF